MNITDRVAYIRGMAEGMEFDMTTPAGKLIEQIIEALSETAVRLNELQESYEDVCEYVESIDEDLEELEMEVHGEKEDEFGDDDDDDSFDDMLLDDFDDDDDDDDEYDDDDYDDDDDLFDTILCCTCPECGGLFAVDKDDEDEEEEISFNQKYVCPHCDKAVEPVPMNFEELMIAQPADEE